MTKKVSFDGNECQKLTQNAIIRHNGNHSLACSVFGNEAQGIEFTYVCL